MKKFLPMILVAGIALAIGVLISTYWYNRPHPRQTSFGKGKPRSKTPGIILTAVPAKTVDANGQPIDQAQQFSMKQNPLYIAIKLHTPPSGTKIEYVRYLNGKYLDHRSITIKKALVPYANFQWKLPTPVATHLPGTYLVKLYTNGIFEQSVSFTIARTVAGGYLLAYQP